MKQQRVTQNLGRNRSSEHEAIYDYIERVLGITEKTCGRGKNGRVNKYEQVHVGLNPLPIRQFNLHKAFKNTDGTVTVLNKTGLQSACILCDGAYRSGRSVENHLKYDPLSDNEIRRVFVREYGPTSHCSGCGQDLPPKAFRISRGMEKGLHNKCLICDQSYSEAVGNRWAIYSPDGRNDIKRGTRCAMVECTKTAALHKDHIWPLAKGGTDWPDNIQFLCTTHNLRKSSSIVGIVSVHAVKKHMICERYHKVLKQAKAEKWSIDEFAKEMGRRVRALILEKKAMNDEELLEFFKTEKVRNNRKHGIARTARKFREYADTAMLATVGYSAKDS